MPRSVKHGGKKVKRVTGNLKNKATNKKRAANRKKMIHTQCKPIADAWNKDKTAQQNITKMGLVYNLNKAMPIKQSFRKGIDQMVIEEGSLAEVRALGSVQEQQKRTEVTSFLETEAHNATEKQKGRKKRLLDRDIEFCIYMMNRHGVDYVAMARDSRNLFQDTPKQIQRKIRIYKESDDYKLMQAATMEE